MAARITSTEWQTGLRPYFVLFFFLISLVFVCFLVDGQWTAVKGWSIGTLWSQARVSCDALLNHQHSAVWENSHQIHNPREELSYAYIILWIMQDVKLFWRCLHACSVDFNWIRGDLTHCLSPQMQMRFDGLLGFPGGWVFPLLCFICSNTWL